MLNMGNYLFKVFEEFLEIKSFFVSSIIIIICA